MLKGAIVPAAGRRKLRKSLVSVAAAAMLAATLVPQAAPTAEAAQKAKAPPKTGAKAALPTNKLSAEPKRGKSSLDKGMKNLEAQDKLGNF